MGLSAKLFYHENRENRQKTVRVKSYILHSKDLDKR